MLWGRLSVPPGQAVLRSDAFRRVEASSAVADNTVTGTVTDARFRGDRYDLTISTEPGGAELLVRDARPAAPGDRLCFAIDPAAVANLEVSL